MQAKNYFVGGEGQSVCGRRRLGASLDSLGRQVHAIAETDYEFANVGDQTLASDTELRRSARRDRSVGVEQTREKRSALCH